MVLLLPTALLCISARVSLGDSRFRGSQYAFEEDGYTSIADPQFMKQCIPKWQEECRASYSHDAELQQKLCDTYLDRNYVIIRTMIPQNDILQRWSKYKGWKDFDRGFFAAHIPRFTETGFQKIKLPDQLHSAVQDWYRQHRQNSKPESSQPAFGMNCNTGYDNDDWVIHPDEAVLNPVEEHIRQKLADWTGQNVNERTALYGVREYHRGSICGLHVDNMETHAFSAIYQVDQRGMDESWASDYVTHQGEEGKAYLQPGEVLLYESASSLHGRRSPLRGDEFANLFFHFRSPNWLPAVQKVIDGVYWPTRRQYEHFQGRPLLPDSKPAQRTFTSDDKCLEIRDRKNALLQAGQFTDPPKKEAYSLPDAIDVRDQEYL